MHSIVVFVLPMGIPAVAHTVGQFNCIEMGSIVKHYPLFLQMVSLPSCVICRISQFCHALLWVHVFVDTHQ